jgi:RNA polymerase sigma-70 factor (ECF subfamily)
MFRHLVGRHEASLVAFLLGRLSDRDEAVEAAQETMVRAYFALPKLKKPEAFSSWLLGIADHVAKESMRRKRRSPRLDGDTVLDSVAARAETDRSPDSTLARAVAGLPEEQRNVILLRFYGNQSCDEIGRHLGVSLGTVTSRLSRAYSRLREVLRDHHRDGELGS